MIEVEWWEHDDMAAMAEAVAGDIAFIIESALDARGDALVALPGGRTPEPIFERLAKAKLNWRRVTVVPTDDRLVPVDSPLSNAAMIARHFMPRGARVLPIGSDNPDYKAAGRAADARLADLPWPPDLVWLGIGADGHTASIFPGPDLDEALSGPRTRRALGVLPDPLPAEAPVARVTLSKSAILSARTLLNTLTGTEKRALLERAIDDGALSDSVVGRVLADATVPIDIHWSPA